MGFGLESFDFFEETVHVIRSDASFEPFTKNAPLIHTKVLLHFVYPDWVEIYTVAF